MNKKTIKILIITILFIALTTNVLATTQLAKKMPSGSDYYYEEMSPNSSFNDATIIVTAPSASDKRTHEKVVRGYLSGTNTEDYYQLYINTYQTVTIKLSQMNQSCDFDIEIYNPSKTKIYESKNRGNGIGEWVAFGSGNTSGNYYIKVIRYSGISGDGAYHLYTFTGGDSGNDEIFHQSFYITQANSADNGFMYKLGRDQTDNYTSVVFLSFGAMTKSGAIYGIRDLGGNTVPLTGTGTDRSVKKAVENFIAGYNANSKHTTNITVIVSIHNKPSPANSLPNSSDYTAHGTAFANMVSSISTSGKVTSIQAGIDAEMSYNNPSLTRLWVDGFLNAGKSKYLYNFGNHLGSASDYSGTANPSWSVTAEGTSGTYTWTAADVFYISYGSYRYCVPEIYNSNDAKRWAYLEKWGNVQNKGYLTFRGIMSTNGWGGLYKNQQSYNALNNELNNMGYGQSFPVLTWIALDNKAQPN